MSDTDTQAQVSSRAAADRRHVELFLFLLTWIAFGFFHQGGGWNQNARFAMVRAMVEQGRLSVDSYLFYSEAQRTESGPRLVRMPLEEGGFTFRGQRFLVSWKDASGEPVPVGGGTSERELMPLNRITASPDVAYFEGRFHPAKAPGTALLAVPAYFVLFHVEKLLDLDPDQWWVLTVNAWLSTVFSIGLISALGCVVFFRMALMLWGGRPLAALLATLAYGFGTMFFAYATMLYEHNVVAVALLCSTYLALRSREQTTRVWSRIQLALSGATVGYAAASSYLAAVVVLLLGGYLVVRGFRRQAWPWFVLGLSGPLLLVLLYNQMCFGNPFATSYSFQNPMFHNGGPSFLHALQWPHLERLALLLFSPFRGLFLSSPFLLMGVVGLVQMWRTRARRPEALLFSAILGFYLLFNISFSGWHGAWGAFPRHLGPALPFLALAATYGFVRFFKTTTVLASVSILVVGLVTVVDPQTPVGLSSISAFPDRARWVRSPVSEYALPIFLTGSAWPILDAQLEGRMRFFERELDEQGDTPAESRATRLSEERERLETAYRKGEAPFSLVQWRGPVSANPIGIYESWVGRVILVDSPELRWNSFNAGELVAPSRQWSLLLLVAFCAPLLVVAVGTAREMERRERRPNPARDPNPGAGSWPVAE